MAPTPPLWQSQPRPPSPRLLSRSRRRRPASLGWLPVLLAALVMFAPTVWGVSPACKNDHCARQYQQALVSAGIRRGPTDAYCVVLRHYSECLRATARSCRGHLPYHTTSSLVLQWNSEYNCSLRNTTGILAPGPFKPPPQSSSSLGGAGGQNQLSSSSSSSSFSSLYTKGEEKGIRPPPVTNTACSYHGSSEMTYCSLFGDPHLVTFAGEFQTCKVAGAWPLMDNAYLAVSVTNEAVVPGSPATATTKVTIIIKGGTDCTPERTYEASVDSVPASFVDGSQWGGSIPASVYASWSANSLTGQATSALLEAAASVRIVEKEPGKHVEIHVRHLGATFVVRQVARYLTFTAKLPKEVAEQGMSSTREGLQLCVKGCPASERIDVNSVIGMVVPPLAAGGRLLRGVHEHQRIPRDTALAMCRELNLTDYYLDSCLFDVMTTGDPSFATAALRAQSDLAHLLPEAAAKLSNRTWPPVLDQVKETQTAPSSATSVLEAHGPGRPWAGLVCAWLVLYVTVWLR